MGKRLNLSKLTKVLHKTASIQFEEYKKNWVKSVLKLYFDNKANFPNDEDYDVWYENNKSQITDEIVGCSYEQRNRGVSYCVVFNTDSNLEEEGENYDDYEKIPQLSSSSFTFVLTESNNILNEEFFKRYKVSQQYMWQKYKSIPTLYLIKGKNAVQSSDFVLPESFTNLLLESKLGSEYDFFVIPLLKNLSSDITHYSQIEKYIFKFKKVLDKIKNECKIHPKYLGNGADGFAFDIGGDRVLKITSNNTTYAAALKSIDLLFSNSRLGKTETLIYDAGEIGHVLGYTFYYIIMEQMKPVYTSEISSDVNLILYSIDDYIERNPKLFTYLRQLVKNNGELNVSSTLVKVFKRIVAEIKSRIIEEYGDEFIVDVTSSGNLGKNWLENYIEEVLFKYVTLRCDLHLGNLGITNGGQLRYYDPVIDDNMDYLNIH